MQQRVRDAARSGRAVVGEGLAAALAPIAPPVAYLDFETMSPAIPLYPGTRPYDMIPFQWSLHRADASGGLARRGFLASGRGDPRRPFAERLLEAAGSDDARIVVYSSFEQTQLAALMALFPDLADPLYDLIQRLFDPLAISARSS